MNLGDDFSFALSGAGSVPVRVTRHAREQWRSRVPDYLLDPYPLNKSTWRHAEIVIAPEANCDETRLVTIPEARDMLLCGIHEPDETVLVTALYAHHDRLHRP